MIHSKAKLSKNVIKFLVKAQKNEITEWLIYDKLSKIVKDKENKKILEKISKEEKKHYNIWKEYTKVSVKPNKGRVLLFVIISRILGLEFGIKLMEK
jgi:rubrerythrin